MDLSIIVPTKDLLVKKNYYGIQGGGEVFKYGNVSLWGSAIYELWDGDDIYEDLSYRIKVLISDIDCAEYHEDFSMKTQDELQAEKERVVEGIQILTKMKYPLTGLYKDMKLCIYAGNSYVEKRNSYNKKNQNK